MQLSIFQKGVLVIVGPLLLWIGFVATLGYLLHQAEQDMEREVHSKEVLACLDKVAQSGLMCVVGVRMYTDTGNMDGLQRFQEQNEILCSEVERAVALTKDNPEQAALMKTIKASVSESMEVLQQAVASKKPLREFLLSNGITPGNESNPFARTLYAVHELTADAEQVRDDNKQAREKVRATIQKILVGGVTFNILLTLCLIRLFSSNITDRLKLHMDNTIRLLKRESLNPPVGGGDEIANLDKVLHSTAKELIELEKFKKELTAVVSHELRTPLTSVHGVILLLQCGALGQQTEKAQRKLSIAERNTRRLIKLINDLLDIEKMEAHSMPMSISPYELDGIIDEATAAVLEFGLTKGVTVKANPSGMWVNADSERLVQVVINLLSNAIKYSPTDSTVIIESHRHGDFAEVKVIDNGPGIPEEFRSRIFDKFQQVNESAPTEQEGTGLGLAICKAIIEQHGGQIGVDSSIGQGSAFWFRVPIATASSKISVEDGSMNHQNS